MELARSNSGDKNRTRRRRPRGRTPDTTTRAETQSDADVEAGARGSNGSAKSEQGVATRTRDESRTDSKDRPKRRRSASGKPSRGKSSATVETPVVAESGFTKLGLNATSLKTLADIGYEQPTPIQVSFIPIAVKGVDCTGQARTGTGKTAAFILPSLERIDFASPHPQTIVLTPTRELSEQVANEARRLSPGHNCRTAVLVGGRPIRRQLDELQRGVHIVVGTPGRVIDLINRGALDLTRLKVVILDEADRMLDIGFRPDIERILRSCPTERQTLLLSATMPPPVERLARRYMKDPQRVDLSEDTVMVDTIEQYYITVERDRKRSLLVKLLALERPAQVLVFTRTKRGAEELHKHFAGRLPHVDVIHGDLHQSKRDRVMRRFRAGEVRMMIATDVVGRGIDVSGISHIVNYDVPEDCDDYVHRVGRTGRISSNSKGRAFTFVTQGQGDELTRIEMRINEMLPEYHVDGFEAYKPSGPRKTVNDPPPELPHQVDEEEFCVFVD